MYLVTSLTFNASEGFKNRRFLLIDFEVIKTAANIFEIKAFTSDRQNLYLQSNFTKHEILLLYKRTHHPRR